MKALLVLLLCLPISCFAQRIYVEHYGNDEAGKAVVFAFKEAVRHSTSFTLTDDPKYAIHVNIDSMDRWVEGVQAQPPKGTASYLSVVVYLNAPSKTCSDAPTDIYLYHHMAMAGYSNTKRLGESLLVDIDSVWAALSHVPAIRPIDQCLSVNQLVTRRNRGL